MNRDQLLARFTDLGMWGQNGQRAPHKPLLIMFALAEWARGRHSIRFADAQKPLTDLLRDYGPPRGKYRPHDPFWRLQKDGVWNVIPSSVQIGADGSPTPGELLRVDATGRFAPDICSAFIAEPALISVLAQVVLQTHFPESLHQDILDAVGLELAEPRAGGGGRDPNFRRRVLTAYEYRCAVCGFQILLSGTPVAIEAAHIKWHQAAGPAIVPNGLALCVLHHKLFDLGGFSLNQEGMVLVSDQTSGLAGFAEHLLSYHGRMLLKPIHSQDLPNAEFISWHAQEVFRGAPRPV